MVEITAAAVKNLRQKTGAGMMDCKKALIENNGDLDLAIDWLRKKGLASAAKKSDRLAVEGLIAISSKDNQAIIIELNSETDFVALNSKFQTLATNIADLAAEQKIIKLEDLKNASYPDSKRNVEEEISENIATIGENINLRRISSISVDHGVIGSYLHNKVTDKLAKIGVLVALEASAPKDKLEIIAKQLAMHIAAAKPEVLTIEELSEHNIEREKKISIEQAKANNKPDSIIQKMVDSRLHKYYQETVLLEQPFVIDNKITIKQVIDKLAKDLGTEVRITEFIRFTLGEGIDQEAADSTLDADQVTKSH